MVRNHVVGGLELFFNLVCEVQKVDAELLRRQVRRVVLHEVAHHFGISDERLIEIDRY